VRPVTPTAPTVAWFDGQLVDLQDARVPLTDRGLQFGESLYEVIPVANGEARLLAEHAQRLRAGAGELGLREGAPDEARWAEIAGTLIGREGLQEGLIYAQLTGGVAPRLHVVEPPPPPRFWAYLQPYRFPRAADVERGIRAVTVSDLRWGRCDLKTTMLLPAVLAKREAARAGAGEALFTSDDKRLREGASSNVIAVEGRTLVTPEQTRHLLPGITRPLIGRIAAEAGFEMQAEDLPADRATAADELFIVSTAALVMPVTQLDEVPIGGGRPGPVAMELAARLRAAWGLSD
jgi:D-alanine transaminase